MSDETGLAIVNAIKELNETLKSALITEDGEEFNIGNSLCQIQEYLNPDPTDHESIGWLLCDINTNLGGILSCLCEGD